jgi:hydrogenase maturation protease
VAGRILVLGVGNPLLRDEGVGVLAVQALMAEDWPPEVDFLDAGTLTQDLFHLQEGYAAFLILDVARFGGRPGEVRVLDAGDLPAPRGPAASLHELDLLESLRLAQELGSRPRVRLVVMEPGDCEDYGLELTPEARAGMPGMLAAARAEIAELLRGRIRPEACSLPGHPGG